MATRANVMIVGGGPFYLYHHCDGYPSYLGVTLRSFFGNKPGYDAAELATAILKGGVTYNRDGKTVADNDYELTSGIHGDIDYFYVFDCTTRQFTCYNVSCLPSEKMDYQNILKHGVIVTEF